MRFSIGMIAVLMMSSTCSHAAVTGFYAGPSLGYSGNKIKFDTTSTLTGVPISDGKKTYGSFLGGLVAGWGFRSNCLYAGFEVEALYNNADHNFIKDKTASDEVFNLRRKAQYGAALRFGYSTKNNILIYTRLGLTNGYWRIKYRAIDAAIPAGSFSRAKTSSQTTVTPGFGIEGMVSKKISLRGEVRFVTPFNKRFAVGAVPGAVLQYEESKMLARLSQTSVMFSALYHF